MSLIDLKFKGELGEEIKLSIPNLPGGEQFERWGQTIVRVNSHNSALESEFGIEYSDLQHLLGQLTLVRPREKIEWETMEGNIKLEFNMSALGNIELSMILNDSKSFCRSAIFRMNITIQQVELAISRLKSLLSLKDKNPDS